MTVTAQRLLTELGYKAWSGFNADDMVFTSDDSLQARTELNCALRYLYNLESFNFRKLELALTCIAKKYKYNIPVGQIDKVYNTDTLEELTFIGDPAKYDKSETGTPVSYWIDTDNPTQRIRLYPIPDGKYNINVVYSQFEPVLTVDGDTAFEFVNEDDYINLPENLEYLFMDCLVMRTMIQNNKDDQDENYKPMINEFNEMWRVFKRACKPVKVFGRIVW
ncbi:MAG: hypothetical protein LUH05_03970 [Candidatus Gastranaerophilales bacterium]|nr:hypothetical protein [Candidatus Gastranaerophilales bacterium]